MNERSLLDTGFRALLDAAPDATVVIDSLGKVVALNHEVERLLGWSEEELLGQPMNRLIPPRFHRTLDTPPVFNQGPPEKQPKGTRVSLFARRRDGSEFPVEIHQGPLGPGPDSLVLVTLRHHPHLHFRHHQGADREHGWSLPPRGARGRPGRGGAAAAAGWNGSGHRRFGRADPGP